MIERKFDVPERSSPFPHRGYRERGRIVIRVAAFVSVRDHQQRLEPSDQRIQLFE